MKRDRDTFTSSVSGHKYATKLSAEVADKLVWAAREGLPLAVAANWAGVSASRLTAWLTKGKRQEEGLYQELYRRIHEAKAAFQHDCLQGIKRAADQGQWQAYAWLLERRFPLQWAKRSTINQHVKHEEVKPKEVRKKLLSRIDKLSVKKPEGEVIH